MSLKSETFEAMTTTAVSADDTYLPLSTPAESDLKALLSDEDAYIFLAIAGCSTYEVVKLTLTADTLTMTRGQGGTCAVAHECGARVFAPSPLLIATVKDLICNYNCCEDACCETEAVKIAGTVVPSATQGKQWDGYVVFTGSGTVNAGVNNIPAWMSVAYENKTLHLSGIPDVAGTFTISVAGTNCNGENVVTDSITVTVDVSQ